MRFLIFYIKKGNFLKTICDQNIHPKHTKLHHFKKNFRGGMPPNPLSKAHGFAMRSMSLRDMQISKSEKKILGPPLPNPGDAPGKATMYREVIKFISYIHVIYIQCSYNDINFTYLYMCTNYLCHLANIIDIQWSLPV